MLALRGIRIRGPKCLEYNRNFGAACGRWQAIGEPLRAGWYDAVGWTSRDRAGTLQA